MGTGDVWFFDRIAPLYDLLTPDPDPADLRSAIDRADRPIERILDIGGGTGRGTRDLTGTDRIVLDAARNMLHRVPPGLHRVHASATALPIQDHAVDAVLIMDALHHLPATDIVLTEAARVLAPGGILVIRDFDPTTIRGRLIRVWERALGFGSTFFSPSALLTRLTTHGFHAELHDPGFAYTVIGTKPRHQ